MRFVIQRVSHAQVTIDGQVRGSIQKGYMVLIGIGQEDKEALADRMIAKMLDLRIFEDADGKSNLSLRDVDGALLLISSLPYMQTAKKENVLPSLKPESRIWQMICMNTSSGNAKKK